MRPGDILSLEPGGSYTFGAGVTGFSNIPSGFPLCWTTVKGNGATITGGANQLSIASKKYIRFQDVELIDATSRSIMVDTNSRFLHFENIYADSNVGVSFFDVFRFNASRNITVKNCEAGPSSGWGEHDGFECTNQCGDISFINCHAEGVIHGYETWSDGGALTWVNYRISIVNCSAEDCEVGYSAEGGPAGLSQVDMIVTDSTSVGMDEYDFQGIDGSTIYRKNSPGTTNGSVVTL
jgi:hypothetical protein